MAFDSLSTLTVTLNDLGLKIAPPPAGPKVTLLGITSNSAIPLRDPFQVTNIGQAASSLYFSGANGGTYPGELSLALEEAVGGGARAIEIVVIGHYSGAALDTYVSPTNAASTRYDDLTQAYEVIKHTNLDVVVPVSAWADATGVTGAYGTQLANFCYQAASEFDNTCIGLIGMMPILHWAYTWQDSIQSASAAISGELVDFFGTTAAPTASYTGNMAFGIPSISLVDEWAKYASQQHDDLTSATGQVEDADIGFPTIFANYLKGSTDPDGTFYPENSANAATSVNSSYWTSWQATNSAGTAQTDQKGNEVDSGRRVCIVGSPMMTANNQVKALAIGLGGALSNTVYNTDGAAAYAGFVTTLVPHSSTTNKVVPNLAARRALSAKQANMLAARRITTFLNKRAGHTVASGVTGAHNVSKYVRSDFVRLSTMRIVDAALKGIKGVAEPFLGEANTAVNRNAMQAEIDKVLFRLQTAGALNGYEFFVSATPDQQVLGEVEIDLTLVPAFEITKITQSVSLAKAL